MPNIEDLNTSFDKTINFLPIASSSQQCSTTVQQAVDRRVNYSLETARNMKESLPVSQLSCASSFGLWSSYMNYGGNENEQEITLTQLHSIESTQYLWNLQPWKDACEEYHKKMKCVNIREIKRQMRYSKGSVFPFLIALIVKENNTKDALALKSTITITLRDPSGEIKAMISKNLWDYNQHIQPNSVLVLRHFRVFPITRVATKYYYLMLNQWNIETIFSTNNDNSAIKLLLLGKDDIEKYQQSLETRVHCKRMTINNIKVRETLKTQGNQYTALSSSNTTTNKLKENENDKIKTSNCHEKGEVTFSNQTTLILPDLDLDLDEESDFDFNYTPCKKLKPDINITHDQQQQTQEDRDQLNVITDFEEVNKILTNVVHNAPKKSFKSVKRNNASTVSNEVRTSATIHSDSGTMVVERHSQVLFKTQNADDSRIVEEVFEGIDVLCFLDEV